MLRNVTIYKCNEYSTNIYCGRCNNETIPLHVIILRWLDRKEIAWQFKPNSSIRMYDRTIYCIKNLSVFSASIFQIFLRQMDFTYAYILKICIQMEIHVEWNLHLKCISRILKCNSSISGQVLAQLISLPPISLYFLSLKVLPRSGLPTGQCPDCHAHLLQVLPHTAANL